jgi:hypothetical protein
MGLMDKLRSLVGKNKEPVKDGVDKAADVADDKTGGKHTEKIDDAAEKVKDKVDEVAGDEGGGPSGGAP